MFMSSDSLSESLFTGDSGEGGSGEEEASSGSAPPR